MHWRSKKRSRDTGGVASRKRWGWRIFAFILLLLVLAACVGRAILPSVLRDYVNRTLDRNPLYSGKIGPVQVHLWRGAYSIHNVRISKSNGNVPVPLLSAKRIDFTVEWKALLHRRAVGRIVLEQPELNFVDAPVPEDSQTGAGGPWLEMTRDLFPFTINSAIIRHGSVHFRTYQSQKPVDIYLSHLEATIDDLSNIWRETKPLIAKVQATALVMDQAKLSFRMALDPFSYRPTFQLAVRLLGLDVTRLNDFAATYGKFRFKAGWFDLVIQSDSKEGQLVGYVKPLFRDLKAFSLREDVEEDTVLQFFWHALIGATTSILKNPVRHQVGTLIPFTGDASGAKTTDILATLGNLLRNAFVRAYLPMLEHAPEAASEGLQFEAPEPLEQFAVGEESQ